LPSIVTLARLLAVLAVSGCLGDTSGPRVDSVSHFLARCLADADCGKGYACLCAVCTLPCEETSTCAELGAECVSRTAAQCGSAGGEDFCGLGCAQDGDCGRGLLCEEGLCVSPSRCDEEDLTRDGAVVVEVEGGGALIEGQTARCDTPLTARCADEVRWFVDDVEVGKGRTLESDKFDKGQSIRCEASLGARTGVSRPRLVENAPPVVVGLELTPTSVLPDAFLECRVVGLSDPDPGDGPPALQYEWLWKRPGENGIFADQTAETLDAALVGPTDEVVCRVSAKDIDGAQVTLDSTSARLDCASFMVAMSFAGEPVLKRAVRGKLPDEADLRFVVRGLAGEVASATLDDVAVTDMAGGTRMAEDLGTAAGWELCADGGEGATIEGEARAEANWQVFSPIDTVRTEGGISVGFGLSWSASTAAFEVGLEEPTTTLCTEGGPVAGEGAWVAFGTGLEQAGDGATVGAVTWGGERLTSPWATPLVGRYPVEARLWPSCGIESLERHACLLRRGSLGSERCNGLDDDCDGDVDEGLCGCEPTRAVVWTERWSHALDTRPGLAELIAGQWNSQTVTAVEGRDCLLQSSDWNYAFFTMDRGDARFEALEAEVFWPGRDRTSIGLFMHGTRSGMNFVTESLSLGIRAGYLWGLFGGSTVMGGQVMGGTGLGQPLSAGWHKLRLEVDRECGSAKVVVDGEVWASDIELAQDWIAGPTIGLASFGVAPTTAPDVCWSNVRLFDGAR
jgi:hypothetical protein